MSEPTAAAIRVVQRLFGSGASIDDLSDIALAQEIDAVAHFPQIREALKLGLHHARKRPGVAGIHVEQIQAAIKLLEKP